MRAQQGGRLRKKKQEDWLRGREGRFQVLRCDGIDRWVLLAGGGGSRLHRPAVLESCSAVMAVSTLLTPKPAVSSLDFSCIWTLACPFTLGCSLPPPPLSPALAMPGSQIATWGIRPSVHTGLAERRYGSARGLLRYAGWSEDFWVLMFTCLKETGGKTPYFNS